MEHADQGYSVALSADGNTAIVGGPGDNSNAGAAWVFTRSGGVWTQQGSKLVGTGAVGTADQGCSVALSADGNTAIVGGPGDNSDAGAAWVFTRSGGVWTQQGSKLVGTGAVGNADQGISVALSADGNTAIVGGPGDNSNAGAAWVFTRSGGVWTQQGSKLVGTGAVGAAHQGYSVALSADGNTAIVGGPGDNSNAGAAWVFTRSGGVWTQQGSKLVGTGAVGTAEQGYSVALSADGNTAIVGGPGDNSNTGAAWVFVQPTLPSLQVTQTEAIAASRTQGRPTLQVTPSTKIFASGTVGGPFSPSTFSYTLTASSGSATYSITNLPAWLTASSTSGIVTKSGKTITFKVNSHANKLSASTYVGSINFRNATNPVGSTALVASLTPTPPPPPPPPIPAQYTIAVSASPSADGTVSGGGTFPAGSSQTVTATANSGYSFVNWTASGSVVSTSASYTFTLNGNVTLVANFSSPSTGIIPANRITTWKPGVTYNGGIPNRTTIYKTLSPLGGTSDDTPQIQAALDSCPANQVVMLAAGTFNINGNGLWFRTSNCTLRGVGPGTGASGGNLAAEMNNNPAGSHLVPGGTGTFLKKADRATNANYGIMYVGGSNEF